MSGMIRKRGFRGGFDGTEWRCAKCNQINFARNVSCYRCGVDKREADLEETRKKLIGLQTQKAFDIIDALNKKSKDEEAGRQGTSNAAEDTPHESKHTSRSNSDDGSKHSKRREGASRERDEKKDASRSKSGERSRRRRRSRSYSREK